MPAALKISHPEFCIYGFRTFLDLNDDYFLKRHQPVDICNDEVWCSLWGTDRILKHYLDELRL
jgi:hypothetical protein